MPTPSSLETTIEIATSLLAELESQAFQEEGFSELSMRQVNYLNTISHMGHPTFSDLAKKLGVTKPSVTAIVGALIRKGYVQKVQDPEDKRSYHIVITPKAVDFEKIHVSMHQRIAMLLTSQLDPDEAEQLAKLLEKAVKAYQEKE